MALMEYVEGIVARKIKEKQEKGIYPYCCTHSEIMAELRNDVTSCMCSLHESGRYHGTTNVNKVPMLCLIEEQIQET